MLMVAPARVLPPGADQARDSVLENTGGTGDCPFTDSSDLEPLEDGDGDEQ